MQELKNICKLVQRTYDGKAWHGPSIREVLKDINDQTALKRAGNSHSIIELVAHMTAWRTFVTKRLMGDTTYEISEDVNFATPPDWATALKALEKSQQDLVRAADAISSEQLFKTVANRKYDFFVLLHGVIHHDIYHIGQIQLIKKYL